MTQSLSTSPVAELTPELTRFHALVPCAGAGSRAGTAGPKQYEPIAGQALVLHTLAAIEAVARIGQVMLIVAPGDAFFDGLAHAHRGHHARRQVLAEGGATRAQTVLNGLRALLREGARPHDWALVHDAARCLVTPAQIDALIDACQHDAVGGLLAHRLADTLKSEAGGRVAATLDRAGKWLAQTPQMFRIGPLADALQQAGGAVTDEASAMEALGHRPLLVAGGAQNFKVTYPEDFALAEAILKSRT